MKQAEAISRLTPEVQRVAKTVGREWADVIDAMDAEQEIWLRILSSSEDYAWRLVEMDPGARVKILSDIGDQIGMRYRDDYELFSGNYKYGTVEVREMLEAGCLRPDGREHRTQTETVDLSEGLNRLKRKNSSYFAAVVNYYAFNIPLDNNTQNAKKTLQRGVDALAREMNGEVRKKQAEYHNGPGSRRVLSNAQALARSSTDWHGSPREGRS